MRAHRCKLMQCNVISSVTARALVRATCRRIQCGCRYGAIFVHRKKERKKVLRGDEMDGGSKRPDLARLNRLLVACRPPPLTVAFSAFYLFTRASFSVSFFIERRYAPFFLPRSIAESLVPLQLLAQETPAIASAILWGRVHTSSPCQIDGKRFSDATPRSDDIVIYTHMLNEEKKRKREGRDYHLPI